MKRVVIFLGSGRKKHTYDYAKLLAEELGPDIETELVCLHEYVLKPCVGCLRCFDAGEEHCPLKDDRDVLLEKILVSDGIVFATPNYCFQVSGVMKTFLDRFGFLFHRPRYFAKAATSLVTQGIFGGASIVKYLHFVARGLGTRPVRGVCLTTLEPSTEKVRLRNAKLIRKQAQRFRQTLFAAQRPRPSLLSLLLFRISRTSIRSMLDATACDYRYFAEQGWFSSDYYYPVSLSWIAKGMGRLFDKLAQMKYSRPLVSAK